MYKIVYILFLVVLFGGCSSKHINTTKGTVISKRYKHASSSLYYIADDNVSAHYPQTGFYPLTHNYDAFCARIALIKKAIKTLDLQYFIFEQDETSIAIVQELLRAANRGVKIRILLDDFLQNGNDTIIASLAKHPNIEIKLFNPTHFREFLGWIQLAFNINTLGRRMHNKLLIADNSAVILGGRNIENIYFAADNERIFIDDDILAVGPLSAQASNSFETYWFSPISISIEKLAQPKELYNLSEIEKQIDLLIKKYKTGAYVQDVLKRKFAHYIFSNSLPLIYGDAKLYYDIPTKITASEEDTQTHLSEHLVPIVESAKKSLIIINPYFMPNKKMMQGLKKLVQKGVQIQIVTNSLATNDATGVYAAYQPYQKQLLELGIQLYELSPYSFEYIYKNQSYRKGKIPRSSLHAKTMIIDDHIFIIGSANLDPRSIKLNTEVVAVIDSKELVHTVKQIFLKLIDPKNVYILSLKNKPKQQCIGTCIPTDGKKVIWKTQRQNTQVEYEDNDADAGFFRRLISNFSRWIPLEKYL